jgi:peptide subunit release factor 1 (eRF1)
VDTSYTGEHGLEETLVRGEDLIKELAVTKEKNLLQKFLTEIAKPHGLAVNGFENVMKVLEMGAADTVIMSESYPGKIEGEDPIEFMEQKVQDYGTKLIVVSPDTREGAQFRALGGIGALLRYHVS